MQKQNDNYISWDLNKLFIPRRSQLYPLEPIGIGTSLCESLTGYVSRLADAHCLSVGNLFINVIYPAIKDVQKILQENSSPKNNNDLIKIYYANSWNAAETSAAKIANSLELLTERKDLQFLTLLPWREVIPRPIPTNLYLSWCPLCYNQWRKEEKIIYEPLLWKWMPIVICPVHKTPMVKKCPSCHKHLHILTAHSIAGYCNRCHSWLGANNVTLQENETPNNNEYLIWLANSVGSLIATAPDLNTLPTKEDFKKVVSKIIVKLSNNQPYKFATQIGIAPRTLLSWQAQTNLPMFNNLLKFCFNLQLPYEKVLAGPAFLKNEDMVNAMQFMIPTKNTVKVNIEKVKSNSDRHKEVEKLLMEALKEEPPPSMSELARRLGHKSIRTIQKCHNELYKKLQARYREIIPIRQKRDLNLIREPWEVVYKALEDELNQESPRSARVIANELRPKDYHRVYIKFPGICKKISVKRKKIAQKNSIITKLRQVLNNELKKEHPRSIKEITKEFGYATYRIIARKIPDLYQIYKEQVTNKPFVQKKKMIENGLKEALKEIPPPRLQEVAQRVGYKQAVSLSQLYPKECSEIMSRYRRYQELYNEKLQAELFNALNLSPPIQLYKVAKLIGYPQAFIKKRFPDLCTKIAIKFQEYKSECRLNEQQLLYDKIWSIALDLHKQGVYPSRDKVIAFIDKEFTISKKYLWSVLKLFRDKYSITSR